jgi:hypothetical protein
VAGFLDAETENWDKMGTDEPDEKCNDVEKKSNSLPLNSRLQPEIKPFVDGLGCTGQLSVSSAACSAPTF